jgi:hypothetical protein
LKVEGSKLKIVERCLKVESVSNVWGVQCFANLSAVGGAKPNLDLFQTKSLLVPAFAGRQVLCKKTFCEAKRQKFKLKYCQTELVEVGAI